MRELCVISKREREDKGEKERGRSMRFHVTGDTMTLYASLNIFHRRVNRGKMLRTGSRMIAGSRDVYVFYTNAGDWGI